MVISVRKEGNCVVSETAEDTMLGKTHDGNVRVAFVGPAGALVGALELTVNDAWVLHLALARLLSRGAR